ncbi:MAG: hypothetical protein L6R48_22055 [Planctomycetes bacterium]|nr:hypothetical protein [Planctomycetota bacterium]
MRHHLLMLLLPSCLAMAAESLIPGSTSTLTAIYEKPFDTTLTVGDQKGEWTRAERYGVQFLVEEAERRLAPCGGVLVAWDERQADFTLGGSIDTQALVCDLVGGVRGHLFDPERGAAIDPSLAVMGRAGIGFQNGNITNLYTPYGMASGEVQPIRYEFGLVAEGRVEVMRGLQLTAGVGTTWWFANQSTTLVVGTLPPPASQRPPAAAPYQSSSQGTYGAAASVSAENLGSEAWFQVGLGWRF